MQSVGSSWLMTLLTPSPLLVALMQTATSLPVFLVGLPAGAIADIIDRRKLLLMTQGWMLLVSTILGILTIANMTTAIVLLILTFMLGIGSAFNSPVWQAIVPELVGPRQVAQAVSLNSAGFNLARSVGPALGGIIVALAGPGAVFLLNSASFVGVLAVIYLWKREHTESASPPERIWGAIVAGVRYARHSFALQAVLVRAGVFILAASALWALLPIVSKQELGLDAAGYGVLLGSLGLGAVIGAFSLNRFRSNFPIDTLTSAATIAFALSTLALGYLHNLVLLALLLILGGYAWMTMMSSLNISAQGAAPMWVRARVLAVYLLVFQGGTAIGSFGWGALATAIGNSTTLAIAAAVLALTTTAAIRWRLHRVSTLDVSPARYWEEPELKVAPALEEGPVLVTVEYRVDPENVPRFIEAMHRVGRMRKRTGAYEWELYSDPTQTDRYFETFLARTWAEHLRQHTRPTITDQQIQEQALKLLQPGTEPRTSHYIATHAMRAPRTRTK